ncbi:MAG: alginate export family protein [Candidatus Omnitrophica bacterium]|nr:alginate export family protein [Candidatus Omnitrophota bacterium]
MRRENKGAFLLIIGVTLAIIMISSGKVSAQSAQEERRIEQEKRDVLAETELQILKGEKSLLFDCGGWVDYRYDNYTDDDNDSSSADTLDDEFSADVRLWLKAIFRPAADTAYTNEHSLYVRLKNLIIERRPGDLAGGYDNDGPHLDYGYLVLDFNPLWFELGRRYFSVGRGIAYSNVNDGSAVFLELEDLSIKGFFAHTLPHEDNVDASVPGWDKESDRNFYGLETSYNVTENHDLYGYIVVQRDDSGEDPDEPRHNYTYNSQYFGLGLEGAITQNTNYWAELIRQTGESYIFDNNQRADVDAWAGDFGMMYNWDVYSRPSLYVEYAFGTGDADRESVTDTQGGNTQGDDTNFLYFGYLPAGYTLSPRLSNIHFIKAGAILNPLEKFRFFKNFSFGVDCYRYFKYKEGGGIYDVDATLNDTDIGFEVDLTLNWQVFSDLKCSLQYGTFSPGDAYPDNTDDREEYLYTGFTFTF